MYRFRIHIIQFILLFFGIVVLCQAEPNQLRQLSLKDAIYLAVRQNPNVQANSAKLTTLAVSDNITRI